MTKNESDQAINDAAVCKLGVLLKMFGLTYLLLTLFVLADGAKILGIFPFPSRSHLIFYTSLTKELARRGHEVTVISKFPIEPPMANHTTILLENTYSPADGNTFALQEDEFSFIGMLFMMWNMGLHGCEGAFAQPEIQDLIQRTDLHFDVILIQSLASECFFGFVNKYKAPYIQIMANNIDVCMGDSVGNPHTTSYIPNLFAGYDINMSFRERLLNTLAGVTCTVIRQFYILPKHEKLMRKHFKDLSSPSVYDIDRNASLLLINSHFSLSYPRPLTPNTQEVGAMQVKPPNRLPQDLQQFLDKAENGAIYFSLGSNIRSSDLPSELREVFLDVFSKLKQKVLWKWEMDSLPDQPSNLHVKKWLPQNDILGHPNVRLFITHGGLLSTQEATYHGVPLLAIPFFGDQQTNGERAQKRGYAIVLTIPNITRESLSWALTELLDNPRYRENVKGMSSLLRAQPQTPLEKAVYWTEYVIRHQGAAHLRSAALDLNWYQYYLLDILATVLGSMVVIFFSCTTLYRLIFSKSKTVKSKKTN